MPRAIEILSQEHNITSENVSNAVLLTESFYHFCIAAKADNDIRLSLASAYGLSPQELDIAFVKEKIQILRVILRALLRTEIQLTAEFVALQERFGLVPEQEVPQPILQQFEDTGILIQDAPTLVEFEHVAKQVVLESLDDREKGVPSLVVCGSSGTGKTQLPFSLDIPLLYFSLEPRAQPIYLQFEYIFSIISRRVLQIKCTAACFKALLGFKHV